MYSEYGGSPSRTLSTMSLSVRPARRLPSRSITRSQSFTGVNTYDKAYRNLSVFSTPGLGRKSSRASRMFTSSTKSTKSTKSNPLPKVPQPERLDQVYEALKKGLQSYLQVHQMDLDSLSRQMKESKRNSRLGFLYEVDKQVKVTERYVRRLEFHLSKIEELYEAYCLQRRLRDGADKMVKAYTASPGSKEARDCLVEANKGYREYTENMCVLEGELENQLGEFHIRMNGLAGFARLCAGDQYEILMKYGRQRWKLRGRMEINSKQVWDSEDMLFLPLINDFLAVKVTELKSLANHVVVGSVSCETKDLFTALPQTVAVDINDLGTIKLSLEVTWNPFDKEDQGSVSSSVNKAPSVSKRFSAIFNQSPPDTPSLREQAFFSLPRSLSRGQNWPLLDTFRDTLTQSCSCSDKSPRQPANMLRRREELENGAAWSNSSESSDDSSPLLPGQTPRGAARHTEVAPASDQPAGTGSSSPNPHVSPGSSSNSPQNASGSRDGVAEPPDAAPRPGSPCRDQERRPAKMAEADGEDPAAAEEDGAAPGHAARCYSRSLSHISEGSADGVAPTDRWAGEAGGVASPASRVSVSDVVMELRGGTPEPDAAVDTPRSPDCSSPPGGGDVTYVARRVSVEEDTSRVGESLEDGRLEDGHLEDGGPEDGGPEDVGLEDGGLEDGGLEDSELEDALAAVVSSLDDCRGQFPELQRLEQELKLLQATLKGGSHSRSPSVFSLTVETALGSFDFLDTSDCEEEEEEEEERGERGERGGRRSRGGRSLQDRGVPPPFSPPCSPPCSPLTTGCRTLDDVLVVHLRNCSVQLLRLGTFGPLRCGEMYALDKLLRESRVLETIRRLIRDDPRRRREPSEVIPQLSRTAGAVALWQQSVGLQGSVYCTAAERLMVAVATVYCSPEPVCVCLVERLLDQQFPRRGDRSVVMVTVFQLWSFLDANGVEDLETHLAELEGEVLLVQTLSSGDQDQMVQALRRAAPSSLKGAGLQAVAKLLKDRRGKVSAAASSVLRGLAAQPRQRQAALVCCLELLEDEDLEARVCGCKALASLKAKESIDQLVYLCQTDQQEVRDAAKQTLLLLGEEGKMAHRHVETSQDGLPRIFAPGSMASTAF